MAKELTFSSLNAFSTQHAHLIETLYAEAKCARWGLSRDAFAEVMWRSAKKRFSVVAASDRGSLPAVRSDAHVSAHETETYLKSLHLEDLALACACAAGIETAWEFFIAEFRSDLRSAARAILRASGPASRSGDDARAEDLADSLYAELYGIRSTSDGRRKSLFEYFHGRSKLSTWLRAILAQRHVDLLRSGGKTVSLDAEQEDEPPRELAGRADAVPADPNREQYLARLDRALTSALADLVSRERMILACYYSDQQTLAEIGRMLGEHESTVSRQLDRTRRTLRESVTRRLLHGAPAQDGCAAEPPLDEAQVELAFEYALEDWPFDLSRALSKEEPTADPRDK
jgi:RNA polymerase sigma factor (sigma-70 family)